MTEVGGSAGAAATDIGYDGCCHYDDQEDNAELCREWNGGLRLLTAIGLVKRRLLRLGEGVFFSWAATDFSFSLWERCSP